MIWENQNCKTWFVSLKNLQASWGKTTPEWHKTICVSLESVIHCLVQSENLLLKCVNRNWEDKKMVLAAQRKGEFSCTLRGGGCVPSLDIFAVVPSIISFFSKSLKNREPARGTRNLSYKVSSKNIIRWPVFCCSHEDYETLCQTCVRSL